MSVADKLQNILDAKASIKAAIENKGVDMTNVPLSCYAEKINQIEVGSGSGSGGSGTVDYIELKNTMTEYSNDTLTKIPYGTFQYCKALESISLPNVTELNESEFEGCDSLQYVSLPNVTSVKKGAFIFSPIKYLSLPNVTYIGSQAFEFSGLETVSFPKLENVGGRTFAECSSLESVSLPNVTWLSNEVFYNCTNLKFISLPKFNQINSRFGGGNSAFYHVYDAKMVFEGCGYIEDASLGEYGGEIRSTFFAAERCTILLPNCSHIGTKGLKCARYSMTGFKNVVLGYDSGIIDINNDVFGGDNGIIGPYYDTNLKIYVPDSLVDSYKNDSKWGDAADRIFPLSQYLTENPEDIVYFPNFVMPDVTGYPEGYSFPEFAEDYENKYDIVLHLPKNSKIFVTSVATDSGYSENNIPRWYGFYTSYQYGVNLISFGGNCGVGTYEDGTIGYVSIDKSNLLRHDYLVTKSPQVVYGKVQRFGVDCKNGKIYNNNREVATTGKVLKFDDNIKDDFIFIFGKSIYDTDNGYYVLNKISKIEVYDTSDNLTHELVPYVYNDGQGNIKKGFNDNMTGECYWGVKE